MTQTVVTRTREPVPGTAPGAMAPRATFRRWVLATTVGELAGFSIPAVVGTAVTAAGIRPVVAALALVLAGTGEGAVLGTAQALALRRELPGLRGRAWVAATAAGAAVAWVIGMVPSTFHDQLARLPVAALAALGAIAALALLATIGVAQWLVLRRHLERSAAWIAANALGWLAGLAVVGLAMAATPGGSPVLIAAGAVLGGLGMGLTMALVTGAFLVRLLARSPR